VDPSNGNIVSDFNEQMVTQLGAALFDGTYLWAADGPRADEISVGGVLPGLPAAGTIVNFASTDSNPVALAFDGANIWSINQSANDVTKIQASTVHVLGNYAVGTSPVAGAFDGTNLAVVDQGSGKLTQLLASDGSLVQTFTFGNSGHAHSAISTPDHAVWVSLAPIQGTAGNSLAKLTSIPGPGYQIAATYPIGMTCDYMLFGNVLQPSPSGIWCASSNGLIEEIDFGGNVIKQYIMGGTITGLTLDTGSAGPGGFGQNVWLATTSPSTLVKLPAQ
jgi:hypothetical protein